MGLELFVALKILEPIYIYDLIAVHIIKIKIVGFARNFSVLCIMLYFVLLTNFVILVVFEVIFENLVAYYSSSFIIYLNRFRNEIHFWKSDHHCDIQGTINIHLCNAELYNHFYPAHCKVTISVCYPRQFRIC